MAFHLFESTQETTTTTGTGNISLAGAVSGFVAFSANYSNGDTCTYALFDGTNFEYGLGTYNSAGNTLSRTTVYRSTNGNAAVNWGTGTRQVLVAPLGIVFESLLAPGNTGFPNRTANNSWSWVAAGTVAPLASPTFTGTVTGPDSNTWTSSGISGNIAFTGSPTTTTQAGNDSSTKIATTAFVAGALAAVEAGLEFKSAVSAMSATNLTGTFVNSGGVGDTLTNSGAQAAFATDGQTLAVGSRVLLAGQTTAYQNGIYTVTVAGTGATNWVLTRSTDYNAAADVQIGDLVPVQSGTLYGGSVWLQTTAMVTMDVTSITFIEYLYPKIAFAQVANNLSDMTAATVRTNLALVASATTDTTNASNISSGTLAAARMAVATATVAGAVPTPPNNTTTFLRGDATFASIPSSPSLICRQTVMNGANSAGVPTFLSAVASSLAVTLLASATPVEFTHAYGYTSTGGVDYVNQYNSDQASFWSGLSGVSTNYLSIDRNASSGALTATSTTTQPQYGPTAPSPAGPDWFDTVNMVMRQYSGGNYNTIIQRVYVGEAVATATVTTNVGTGSVAGGGGQASVTSAGIPAGAMVVVGIVDDSGTPTSVTDDASNTYTSAGSVSITNGTIRLYYSVNITALTNTQKVYYNRTGSGNAIMSVMYITGLGSSPVDGAVTATNSGTSSSPSVVSGTPSVSGETFIAWVGNVSGDNFTQAASWASPPTALNNSTSSGIGGTQLNSGTGTLTYNPTQGASAAWGAIVIGLKPNPGISSVTPYAFNGNFCGAWNAGLPNSSTETSVTHNLGLTLYDAKLELLCTTNDHGYVVGELIDEPNTGGNAPMPLRKTYKAMSFANDGTNSLGAQPAGGGAAVALTAASWSYRMRARRAF